MKKSVVFLILLVAISILAVFMPAVPGTIVTEGINSGDVAWMLAATALVLLMTPGLAYFYGGMIDTKNIISTMLQSFIAMGVISVLWIVVGFSLAFGDSIGGFIGNPDGELYVRWLQYGLFCPVFRSHGTDAPREIYQFGKKGEPIYDAIEKIINLRYRLLPYIYSTAWQVTSKDYSYMRPLFSDFASDRKVWNMPNEFMFGSSILAAPIVEASYTQEKIIKESRFMVLLQLQWEMFQVMQLT